MAVLGFSLQLIVRMIGRLERGQEQLQQEMVDLRRELGEMRATVARELGEVQAVLARLGTTVDRVERDVETVARRLEVSHTPQA